MWDKTRQTLIRVLELHNKCNSLDSLVFKEPTVCTQMFLLNPIVLLWVKYIILSVKIALSNENCLRQCYHKVGTHFSCGLTFTFSVTIRYSPSHPFSWRCCVKSRKTTEEGLQRILMNKESHTWKGTSGLLQTRQGSLSR